ncbi:XrtA/PEP-CTERM system TPR-repeat protein PrsT [Desulfovibrio oxyclinae]|uniref:XrtA/PEP-CTERM system TPR-repeat protein PrsT n=1 Tax=Desulfovibrio oxyclinae TaxID=63560 RepID=UPI000372573B|nr:XrtA/PEP-CTERM system TPR-repeat protein PrsT [Desulfovibrio oxyclinae]
MRFLFAIFLFAALLAPVAGCGSSVDEMMNEGTQYLAEGNHQGAIVIFKTVLEKAPEKMDARYGLGRAYLMAGKLNHAEKSFEKYLRQNPYDKRVNLELGRIALARGNYQEASVLLDKYCSENPDSAKGQEYLAAAYSGLGRHEQALERLEKVVRLDPERDTARVALVRTYAELGMKKELDDALTQLLAKWPDHQQGLYLLGARQAAEGDREAYYATYERLSKAHSDDPVARYIMGKNYIEQKRYDDAERVAESLNADFPNSPEGDKLTGLIQFTRKDYGVAIQSFQKALTKRPELETLFFLGLSSYGKGDLETAITHFRNVADRSPKFVRAREMISAILLQQRRVDEAMAEAEKVLETDSQNVAARMTLGDAHMLRGEREQALKMYSSVKSSRPEVTGAYMKLGALQYSLGELTETENTLREAITSASDSFRPRVILASFYLRNGDRNLAEQTLTEGLTGGPEDVAIYNLLARIALSAKEMDRAEELLAKAKSVDPSNPSPYLMRAGLQLAMKQPEEALAEYDALLEQRPEFLRGLLGKAAVLELMDRPEAVEACFEKGLQTGEPEAYAGYASYRIRQQRPEDALKLVSDGLETHRGHQGLEAMRAEVLLSMKRYDDVLEICREKERHSPGSSLGLQTRALMMKGDFEKALVAARQITDFQPKNPGGYLTLYNIHRQLKQDEEAVMALERGLDLCGPTPQLFLTLGRHFAASDPRKALNYLDAAIKRDDKFYQAYSAQGSIYQSMGRTDEAVERYNRALELSDRYVPALNNLATIYVENPETAVEALRLAYTAYVNSPSNLAVMDTLGYTLAKNGKAEEAVKVLEKARELDGANGAVLYHLGYAYRALGNVEQARLALGGALESPDADSANRARKLLDEINGG